MSRHNKLLIELMQSMAKRIREMIYQPKHLYLDKGDSDGTAGWGGEET